MRNLDPLGYPRDEVLIFCQGIADKVYGEIAGYKLENGAPIPKCQPNGTLFYRRVTVPNWPCHDRQTYDICTIILKNFKIQKIKFNPL